MESKEVLEELPWVGKEKIFDCMRRVDNANLHHGRCEMNVFSIDVMIRKGQEIKRKTYELMKIFQHETCIRHLDFYPEANHGRLVLPMVHSSFDKWIKNEGQPHLLDEYGNMSELFKTMIFDLCDLVEKLGAKKILIRNLHLKNLYVADEIIPRILVLITEADQLRGFSKIEQWKPVKEVIECVFRTCEAQPNNEAKRFLGFIVTENFSVKSLKRYPDNWDIQTKRDYLLNLAAKQGAIRSAVRMSIAWPLVNGKLPELLDQIIYHQSQRLNPTLYNSKIPVDYIRLIRDVYKHFDKFPSHIKQEFQSKDGFISCVENWSPDIWKDIYDITGWPYFR